MSRLTRISERLHRGELNVDFVGRRKLWYTLSVLVLVAALGGLLGRGLHLGIEFQGGALYTINQPGISVKEGTRAAQEHSAGDQAIVQKVGKDRLRVQLSGTTSEQSKQVKHDLAKDLKVPSNKIDTQVVGPSWGKEVTKKSVTGLIIFMILVVIYLSIAFEWRMSVSAVIGLLHDLVITVGVYALVGFEVTPGTVIGLLTILGYSLYDTVVVFDTVRDNTRNLTGQNRRTYSEASNLGLNQALVRSINTTVVALLPVSALLFIGGGLLGAGTLNDIALALFIGLTAGAYSSICLVTPFLAALKERDPAMKALHRKVMAKRASDAEKASAVSGEGNVDGDDNGDGAGLSARTSPSGPAGGTGSGATSTRDVPTNGRQQPVSRERGRGRPSGKKR